MYRQVTVVIGLGKRLHVYVFRTTHFFYRLVSRQQKKHVARKSGVHRATATCTLPVQVGEPSEVSPRVLLFIRHGDYFYQAPKYTQLQKLIMSAIVWAKQTAAIIHEKYSNVPLEEDKCLQEGDPEKTHNMERFGRMFKILCTCRTESGHKHHCVPFKYHSVFFCKALGIYVGKWREITLPHCSVTGITICPSYAMHINFVVSCTHLYAVALYFQ